MGRILIIALSLCLFFSSNAASQSQNEKNDREAVLKEARYLKSIYKTEDAIGLLSGLLSSERFDSELLAKMADCHVQAGDYDQAVSTYRMLSAKEQDNILYKIKLMNLSYRLKDYYTCASIGADVMKLDTIPAIISLTGDAFNQMNMKDSALVYYNLCLSLNPTNAGVLSKVAKILLDRKQYNNVLDMTYDYLQVDSTNMDVRGIRGTAFYMKGDYTASEEVFQKMEDDGNDSYNVHFYLGQNQWHNNRHFYARKELEKAWQIDSSDVNLAFSIASVILESAQPIDKAAPWLDKALEMLSPDPAVIARIYRKYGSGYMEAQNYKTAITYYKKSFEQDPKTIIALSSLGYCYERLKDWKKAKEYYDMYLKFEKSGTSGYKFAKESLDYVKQQLFMEEKR